MNKLLIALAGAGLLFASAGQTAAVASEGAKPALTEEASGALAQAEANIKLGEEKENVWTTAVKALKKAKAAAAKGDSAMVIEESKVASDLAILGVEQTKYPLTHF